MFYCGPRGIAHDVFLQWPQSSQDKALAFLAFENSICRGCGTFPSEYLDNEGRMISPPPYVVRTEICYGCAQMDDKRKEIGKHDVAGISMRMAPNPEFRHEQQSRN